MSYVFYDTIILFYCIPLVYVNITYINICIYIYIYNNKMYLYSTQHSTIDDICVATSIRELYESRDSEYTNFFDRNESRKLIEFLCTT